MTRLYANTDALEPLSDTDGELKANQGSHHVIQGCAVTADTTNLTVDLAAGVIALDYVYTTVAVQANGWTLVADGSNPRWTWLEIDSSGVCQITSGTAAADPVVPELGGNRVPVALVKIPAAATLASNCTFLDKRVPLPDTFTRYKTAESQVVNNSETPVSDDTLFFPVAAGETWVGECKLYISSNSGDGFDYEFTCPSTPTAIAYWTKFCYSQPSALVTGNPSSEVPATASGSNVGTIWATDVLAVQTVHFYLANGATAGTMQFRWAQYNADTADTILKIGSSLTAKRIA